VHSDQDHPDSLACVPIEGGEASAAAKDEKRDRAEDQGCQAECRRNQHQRY